MLNRRELKQFVKNMGGTAKVLGSFGKEVAKRTFSPKYYKERVINPTLKKK